MLPFTQALPLMLRGALLAHAQVRGFRIEDEAANFLVERALRNIAESTQGIESRQYSAAVIAVINLPNFLTVLELQAQTREMDTGDDARSAVERVRCNFIYPWCTNQS